MSMGSPIQDMSQCDNDDDRSLSDVEIAQSSVQYSTRSFTRPLFSY